MQLDSPSTSSSTDFDHPALDKIKADLAEIGLDVFTSYTVADAMREGAKHTEQKHGGWVDPARSCGLGAVWLSAKARGYIAD